MELITYTDKVYWVMMHSKGRQQFLNFKMIYEVEHWSELDNKLLSACSSSSKFVYGWFVFNPFSVITWQLTQPGTYRDEDLDLTLIQHLWDELERLWARPDH